METEYILCRCRSGYTYTKKVETVVDGNQTTETAKTKGKNSCSEYNLLERFCLCNEPYNQTMFK